MGTFFGVIFRVFFKGVFLMFFNAFLLYKNFYRSIKSNREIEISHFRSNKRIERKGIYKRV